MESTAFLIEIKTVRAFSRCFDSPLVLSFTRKEVRRVEYNVALFNAITDALETLEAARDILITAQRTAEEIYICAADQNNAEIG